MTVVDSHCHLDDSQFDGDREQAVERALEAGVRRMVVIGTGDGPPDMDAGIRMAEQYDCVSATAGVHPQYAAQSSDADLKRVEEIARHPKVIAIGEIGLDYYRDQSAIDKQKDVFRAHMQIARAAGKPIVIHTREAWNDTLDMLREHWPGDGPACILHCFTGGPEQARQAAEAGYFLSFGGIVTYPKSTDLQAAARIAPAELLLVETDAPYLAPAPHRGKRNEPSFVVHSLRKLAELRGESPENLAATTTRNFERAFATPISMGS